MKSCCRKVLRQPDNRLPSQSIEEMIRNTDGVDEVMSVVGYSLLDGQVKSNSGLLVVTLKRC